MLTEEQKNAILKLANPEWAASLFLKQQDAYIEHLKKESISKAKQYEKFLRKIMNPEFPIGFRKTTWVDRFKMYYYGFNLEVIKTFWHWIPYTTIEVESIRLHPVELFRDNEDAVTYKIGFRVFATTEYGDLIGMVKNSNVVYMANHEDSFDYEATQETIRSFLLPLANSMDDFIKMYIGKKVPRDWWDLKEKIG